ncbi:MAG: HD domain-containing protein [Candidatus Eisenbacteria bacterium]|uniref:HD domain-containing protein n=1 Tax=Eiseniibacteriota bacterium TaxID=2212470 RepID=A0A933SEM4_UNCEI|nr:HD domain-containing protein [Candidatus Eisenbacteria bacterium]
MKRSNKSSVPSPAEVPASAPAASGPDPRLALLQTVRALTMVMDGGDPFTRGRTLRISRYAVRVAREMGASEAELVGIELGALLHDLGRTALLNDVVTSPRALDAGERAIVQTHSTIGYDMLKDIPGLEEAAEIVWKHHERPDGKGYPRGLGPERIPLGSRVVMVCAAYDAMTEDRPYRRGLAPRAACEELRRNAGTQFFPEVVECFVTLHDSGKLWDAFTKEEMELYVRRSDLAAA